MKCANCKESFVVTNKVKYSNVCPHCNHDIAKSIKNNQVKELKQVARENYEELILADKVYAECGEFVFRNYRKSI